MDMKECYKQMGGSYDEIMLYMRDETRVMKYLLKFKEDPTAASLDKALQEQNLSDAFYYAHTLKGICLNLCMRDLAKSSSELTEALRAQVHDVDELYGRVQKDYKNAIHAIEALESSMKELS